MSNVTDIDHGWDAVIRALELADTAVAKVGIQSNAGRHDKSKIDMATLGAVQEYGASINVKAGTTTLYNRVKKNGDMKAGFVRKKRSNFARDVAVKAHTINIPARPFMREGTDKATDAVNEKTEQVAKRIMNGTMSVHQGLKIMGQVVERSIKDNMSHGGFKPNAKSTTRKKKSATPLIDTGRLRQSITTVVSYE